MQQEVEDVDGPDPSAASQQLDLLQEVRLGQEGGEVQGQGYQDDDGERQAVDPVEHGVSRDGFR